MTTYDREMTLLEHLEELLLRVKRAVLGLLITTGLGLVFSDQLLQLLLHPLHGAGPGGTDVKLTTLTVLEPFLVKVKIAFLFGLAVAMPWIVYQLFAFINPALTENERRRVVPISLLAGVLFICGVVFAYVFVMPVSTHWLLAQAGTQFNVLITANSYITYMLFFLGIVGGTFETPLVILGLAMLGLVSPQTLRREWRVAYLIAAAIAVFGTPDWSPVTMGLVFLPMILLYHFSVLLVRIFVRPPGHAPVVSVGGG